MGNETDGRKCDARLRFRARKQSLAARADRAAYARRRRHGKSLPATQATTVWARVAGRDGARFGEGGIGEVAEEGTKAREKRPTLNAQRSTPNENGGAWS